MHFSSDIYTYSNYTCPLANPSSNLIPCVFTFTDCQPRIWVWIPLFFFHARKHCSHIVKIDLQLSDLFLRLLLTCLFYIVARWRCPLSVSSTSTTNFCRWKNWAISHWSFRLLQQLYSILSLEFLSSTTVVLNKVTSASDCYNSHWRLFPVH